MKSTFRSFALLVLAPAALSARANLLINGSFETGDFSGWTLDGDPSLNLVDTGFASDGVYAAFLGEQRRNGTLTQSIATVVGQRYTFRFDFSGDGDNPSFFSAAFGGHPVFSVTNPALQYDYTTYSYHLVANAATTDVVFTFRDDPFYVDLDNVRVDAVPGPLAALPFALRLLRRRRLARPSSPPGG